MNHFDFLKMKEQKKKISMVTCYDYTSAKICSESPIDCLLVGDSAAMTVFGHDSTLPIDTPLLGHLVAAVKKGAPEKFIVGDLPFLSYRKSLDDTMNNVELLMKSGANAVKLEGLDGNETAVKHIVQSGIPVMGHLGLTPQSVHQLGGFKVQGKNQAAAKRLKEQALQLQELGAYCIVLEAVPSAVARDITESLQVPTIGIGAGPDTDGQVLVWQDLLGMNTQFKPKFVRTYLDGAKQIGIALSQFDKDVKEIAFPTPAESYEAN